MYLDRQEELLQETSQLIGMVAEVRAKALLFKSMDCPDPESIFQMQDDLDKYSHRLEEIHEELFSYDVQNI